MISAALSVCALLFSALFALFLLAQVHTFAERTRPVALAALMSFSLVALSALTSALHLGLGWPLEAPLYLFQNAAIYLGLPLIAGAYLALYWPWYGSKPFWGRISLALMALFALMRSLELLEPYQAVLATISLGAIIWMGIRARAQRALSGFALIGAASLLSAGAILQDAGDLAGGLRVELFHYLAALSCLFLSSGLFLKLRPRALQAETQTDQDTD